MATVLTCRQQSEWLACYLRSFSATEKRQQVSIGDIDIDHEQLERQILLGIQRAAFGSLAELGARSMIVSRRAPR